MADAFIEAVELRGTENRSGASCGRWTMLAKYIRAQLALAGLSFAF